MSATFATVLSLRRTGLLERLKDVYLYIAVRSALLTRGARQPPWRQPDADIKKTTRAVQPINFLYSKGASDVKRETAKKLDRIFDNIFGEVKEVWWGYIHINGSVQVKIFFSDLDLEEADESPFVRKVFKPFEANSREDAIKIIKLKESSDE